MLIVEHLHSNSAINPLVLFFFFNFMLKSLQSHKKLQRQCKAVLCTLHLVLSYIIIGQYPTQLLASCVSIFLCLKPPVQSRFGLAHPHRDPLASPLLVTLLSLPQHPQSLASMKLFPLSVSVMLKMLWKWNHTVREHFFHAREFP